MVLGKGTAKSGYTAAAIPDQSRGVGLLRAEGKRVPRRVKAAYLTDDDLRRIAARAAILPGPPMTDVLADARSRALHLDVRLPRSRGAGCSRLRWPREPCADRGPRCALHCARAAGLRVPAGTVAVAAAGFP